MRKCSLFLVLILLTVFCAPAMAKGEAVVYPLGLNPGSEATVEGITFSGDVIVSGNNAKLILSNCTILGDLILTSDTGTMVMLLGTTVMGRCIQRNSVKEADIDYSLPKFASDAPVEVELEDCIGGVAALGSFPVVFGGRVYTMDDAQVFFDSTTPEGEIVAYEGQEANVFIVCRWWEGGEEVVLVIAEYDE